MVTGIDAAASGMISVLNMTDIIANNLANVSTNGFKELLPTFKNIGDIALKEKSQDALGNSKSLGKLSMGSALDSALIDMRQGILKQTGNNLDFAIDGEGFFAVNNNGKEYYTRNGSFVLNNDGILSTKDGNPVLNEKGKTIKINTENTTFNKFEVKADGTLSLDGKQLDKLKIVSFQKPADLANVGNSLFTTVNGATPKGAANCKISQGYLESSNSGAIENMINTITASRTYESLSKVVKATEATLDKAVNEVGRVKE